MANKQNFKDRKRDPNPRNRPPERQVKEQKLKGVKSVTKPATQKASRPKKKAAPRKVVSDFAPASAEKKQAKRRDVNPLLRVTDTQSGTIHDEAARLKLRQTEETSPVEQVQVEGNPVEVVARPEVLHPVQVMPHLRDTITKDRLRDSGDPDKVRAADAYVPSTPEPWHPHAEELEKSSPEGRRVVSHSSTPRRRKKKAA